MKKIAKQMLTGLLAIAMVLTMGTPAIPKVYAQDMSCGIRDLSEST